MFPCDRNPDKGATQHARGTDVNKPAQNVKKKYQRLFIQKNRSVFWPGNFAEECLSQYRVDCASEDCVSYRQVKFRNCRCKLSSLERDAVINPPSVITFFLQQNN